MLAQEIVRWTGRRPSRTRRTFATPEKSSARAATGGAGGVGAGVCGGGVSQRGGAPLLEGLHRPWPYMRGGRGTKGAGAWAHFGAWPNGRRGGGEGRGRTCRGAYSRTYFEVINAVSLFTFFSLYIFMR